MLFWALYHVFKSTELKSFESLAESEVIRRSPMSSSALVGNQTQELPPRQAHIRSLSLSLSLSLFFFLFLFISL